MAGYYTTGKGDSKNTLNTVVNLFMLIGIYIIITLYSETRSRTVFFVIIYNRFVDSSKYGSHDFDPPPPAKNSSRAPVYNVARSELMNSCTVRCILHCESKKGPLYFCP